MSSTHVPVHIRRAVTERDKFRCAYCQTQADIVGAYLEIEHIVPRIEGSESIAKNLCLSCSRCNRCKGKRVSARDPIMGETVRLYNPRQDEWFEHFDWDSESVRVIGLSDVGRATVEALRVNAAIAVIARKKWVEVGWHPPSD